MARREPHGNARSERLDVHASPALLPGVAVAGVALVLLLSHGGYASSAWYPAALFVLALAGVVVMAVRMPPGARWRGNRSLLTVLALYSAWGFLSIIWAVSPGLAWDGANRTLMYLLALAAVTVTRWPVRSARMVIAALVGLLTIVAGGVLVATAARTHPESLFITGRLSAPIGYSNATANLWLIGCLPAVWFACDRRTHWLLRGVFLGSAGMLAATALLSQSRGSILAMAGGGLVLLLMAPRRWPVLVALAAVIAGVVAAAGPILRVRDRLDPPSGVVHHGAGAALHDARLAIVIVTVVLIVVGGLAARLDESVSRRLSPVSRLGDRVIAALAVLVVLAGSAATGNPSHWVSMRWNDFKSGSYSKVDASGSRLTGGLGSNRYDFYRVGLDEFVDHPAGGVGLDSFGPGYLQHGRSSESPRYAHSLLIAALAESGIVGAALLGGGFMLAALALTRRRRGHGDDASAAPVAAAAAGAAAFLAGAQVDWLWQFPALGLLGFLLLGIALACHDGAVHVDPRRRGRHRVAVRLAAGLAGVLAALSFALPGIAARFTNAAYSISATNPRLALSRLSKAADLDPLSAGPELARAIIERRVGDVARQRMALDAAVSREPHNWFAYLERAMLESLTGAWAGARRDLATATRLNPRQAILPPVRRALTRHRPVVADVVEAQLASQLAAKLGQGP